MKQQTGRYIVKFCGCLAWIWNSLDTCPVPPFTIHGQTLNEIDPGTPQEGNPETFGAKWKMSQLNALHPESFCAKNLATRKVFAFSDSGPQDTIFLRLQDSPSQDLQSNGFTTWWFLGGLQTEFWLILIIDLPPPLTILPDKVPFEDWIFSTKTFSWKLGRYGSWVSFAAKKFGPKTLFDKDKFWKN